MTAGPSRRLAYQTKASNFNFARLWESTSEYQYRSLDPSVDCTRLIEFELGEDDNDTIRCKLIHVTFGEKPTYEALSYMWGDQTLKKKILVEGKNFLVGLNLWEALHYLRKRANEKRNRQLRIMPHIYMRANQVVVWLGRKYAKYDDEGPAIELASRSKTSLSPRMGDELYSDEYWARVWIVQEIGKARKIQVCVGEGKVAWNVFVGTIKKSIPVVRVGAEKGPLKLEKQLQEKYRRGHTLRELLENHQDAICKDPRDKIYGFVGLGVDAAGFPMDYQKPLWEVWKDTMLFAKRHEMISGSDTVGFGKLVNHLLSDMHRSFPVRLWTRCWNVATNDQVARECNSWTVPRLPLSFTQDPILFNLSAYVAGIIIYAGPSLEQILSVLDAEDEWKKQIQQNFAADLGNAYRDNDLLMQELLDSETDGSYVFSLPNLNIHWGPNATLRSLIDDYKKESDAKLKKESDTKRDLRQFGSIPCNRKLNLMV